MTATDKQVKLPVILILCENPDNNNFVNLHWAAYEDTHERGTLISLLEMAWLLSDPKLK